MIDSRRHSRREQSTSSSLLLLPLAAALLAVAVIGCGGFSGELGTMFFEYSTDEFAGKTALAVSSQIRVQAYAKESSAASNPDAGTADSGSADTGASDGSDQPPVTLTSVRSSSPSIIAVNNIGSPTNNTFELAAKKAGSATITAEGTGPDGKSLKDKFTLEAKEAKQLELKHVCSDDDSNENPVYLTDQKVPVRYNLKVDDEFLTGWGHYPVDVKGSSSAGLDKSREDANTLGVSTGSKAAKIQLAPTIGGSTLEMDVRSESAIDKLGWYIPSSGDPKPLSDPFEGDGGRLLPRFEAGGREVCKADVELSLSNKTPKVCEVSTESFGLGSGNYLLTNSPVGTAILVEGKKEMTCEFDVAVENASGDVSTTVELDLSGGN